jgi:hypothetical protein
LIDIEYLSAWSTGGPDRYALEPKSREFVIKNNLLSGPKSESLDVEKSGRQAAFRTKPD